MATSVLAVVLAAENDDGKASWRLIAGGVFATAVLATKANSALAFLPAFALVVAVGWLRKRWQLRDAGLAAIACLVTLVPVLVLIRGQSPGVAVRWGSFVRYLETHADSPPKLQLLQSLSVQLAGKGPLADIVYFVAFLVFDAAVFTAPALIVWAVVWTVRAVRRRGASGDQAWTVGVSGTAGLLLGTFVGLSVLVSLLVVQPGVGEIGAWNVASHTTANLLWVSAVFLAAGVAVLLPRLEASWEPVQLVALLVVLGFALSFGSVGFTTVYGKYWQRKNTHFVNLVRRLDKTTPADAVVLQDYDTEKVQWVSGFGGRRTPGGARHMDARVLPGRAAPPREAHQDRVLGQDGPSSAPRCQGPRR